MNRGDDPLESQSFFDGFYDFITDHDTDFVTDETRSIIAIIPQRINSNYVHTLTYSYGRFRYHITFKILGKVMLFVPPPNVSYDSLNIQSKDSVFFIHLNFIYSVKDLRSSSLLNLQQSFNDLVDCNQKYENRGNIERQYKVIARDIEQSQVMFGKSNYLNFTKKLNELSIQSHAEFQSIHQMADFIQKFNQEINTLKMVSYATNINFRDKNSIQPRDTSLFLGKVLSKVDSTPIYGIIALYTISFNKYKELDDLMIESMNYTFKPTNNLDHTFEITNDDIAKINTDCLSIPTIFKENNSLKISAKTIEIKCDPQILGVDESPIQIRLPNLTNDEIICELQQTNNDLHLPLYRNEVGFLIIEIPVESLCKNALISQETKSNSDDCCIDFVFKLDGSVLLKLKSDHKLTTDFSYSITLHYVSLTAFIILKGGHHFAINNDKISIIPFYVSANSKLVFEKYINQKVYQPNNLKDTITELTDNNSMAPEFKSKFNEINGQIFNLNAQLPKEYYQKSHTSLNFEFGLTKGKSITATFQADVLQRLTLALYSDETHNFEKENAIVNIGNLTRKVYFVVELLNTDDKNNARISDVSITTNERDNLIYLNYDPIKNNSSIHPNKYDLYSELF